MTDKINDIKRGMKYIIGAVILVTSLNKAAFGVLKKDSDGYYQIGSSVDLKAFAKKINSGRESNAKGKVINNIEFNGGSVIENGVLKEEIFEEWTPIGTDDNPFEGEFISDGGVKKIKGLYVNNENEYSQGLFGVIEKKGKVSNIEVSDSYINGYSYVGGIAGDNKGEISNCITTNNIVTGQGTVGGNIGENGGIMSGECRNSGAVIGETYFIGGNVGYNRGIIFGKIINEGKVTGENNVGGNIGTNDKGIIKGECSNSGKIEGEENIGGNIGANEGVIENDVSVGYSMKNKGPIIGKNNVGGNIGCIGYSGKKINEGKLMNEGTINGESANTAKKIGYQT